MMRRIALLLIRLYQLILSPLIGQSCRFTPTCSRYTAICIERFGFWKGTSLGLRRLAKCHPFGPAGYDPPPSIASDGSPASREGLAAEEGLPWTGKS